MQIDHSCPKRFRIYKITMFLSVQGIFFHHLKINPPYYFSQKFADGFADVLHKSAPKED